MLTLVALVYNRNGSALRMYFKTSGSPWLRWGARVFDNIAILLALGVVISSWPQHIPDEADGFWAIPVLLLWFPVEALFVSLFGATPGKWLFGISVLHHDGSRLTFRTALYRSVSVFLSGMGAGIFAPFTQAWSFWRIAKYGETVWDREYDSVIVWRQSYLRASLGAVLLLAAFHFVTRFWTAAL